MESIVFIDCEVGNNDKIVDFGAIKPNNDILHSAKISDFINFISDCKYICGHNIIAHDLKYLEKYTNFHKNKVIIDTLCLSPLLFPKKPYHKLLKDDKLFSQEKNNPTNDSKKARSLFYDEFNAFKRLSKNMQNILYFLLHKQEEFQGFFKFIGLSYQNIQANDIKEFLKSKFCENANIDEIINSNPIELAYTIAITSVNNNTDDISITPAWVLKKYPKVDAILSILCNTPCEENCSYCNDKLNIYKQLDNFFQYKSFRKYEEEPLQEKACLAAVQNKSLIAIFPTGGGKSLTFQLPALIAGQAVRGLTVVISPLQSLMKDQIDNLEKRGIVDAVTINGLLNPVERKDAIERISSGMATILYISPEQLRSKTIEHLLLSRKVVRFVIDEAHCFSAWGQDFRVDYLYIGDFIKKLKELKGDNYNIAISCFTATAKQKVITDIKDYFKNKLGLELEIYATTATRKNLQYFVIFKKDEEEKYIELRNLIESKKCSTIVYVSTVALTTNLAERLSKDGFPALPYNGKMESMQKIKNQEQFINDEVKIIVATSAFGMGVDKQDVELVIHYDISGSLEDYMQESGRAARKESLQANCYVLYSPKDMDKRFMRLNQDKLSMNDIQQVWHGIKNLTKKRNTIYISAFELARKAGWDLEARSSEAETRIKTALLALEKAGYIKRGNNAPRVYATSINVKSVIDAQKVMNSSHIFNEEQKNLASAILSNLLTSKNSGNSTESRVDWLADSIGRDKKEIIEAITLLRQADILKDENDITVFINIKKAKKSLNEFLNLERRLIDEIEDEAIFNLKKLNEKIEKINIKSSVKNIKSIFNYWNIHKHIKKDDEFHSEERFRINLQETKNELKSLFEKRSELCNFIIEYIEQSIEQNNSIEEQGIQISVVKILNVYNDSSNLFKQKNIILKDIENALLYLKRTDALQLEGGFLVIYNSLEITRLIKDNKIKYKKDDYKFLDEYYKQKIQQIHILGEFLNILKENYEKSLEFVKDYFSLDYKKFLLKYFKGKEEEIRINITPKKYKELFEVLDDTQKKIIKDNSKYIVVVAGPGSGKTKVLVHKLASLLTLENIKTEQLLMLTFSRAAAIEFKKRLYELIGSIAKYVDIKTFHSYCFDLLGKLGSLESSEIIIDEAINFIKNDSAESSKLSKAVIVIDEAQDMSEEEFNLIKAIINFNDEAVRVIAVGDDDQNIYEFRNAKSEYFASFIYKDDAKKYEMVRNYRSAKNIVNFTNEYIKTTKNRLKDNLCFSDREGGIVKITKYNNTNLEIPVIQDFLQSKQNGSTCILTNTNEEASKIVGLLNNNFNIPAKLIQSLDGFKLKELFEIRFFIKIIAKNDPQIVKISDDLWEDAKKKVNNFFKRSACLPLIQKMLNDFEQISPDKYLSDLEIFFNEAKLEDFYEYDKEKVVVSTIHKSKGHEYDNVYIMLNNVNTYRDEDKRKLYVGFTRAKNFLSIHYNNSILDSFRNANNIKFTINNQSYPDTKIITLELTSYKHVHLDYFKDKREKILKHCQSGDILTYKDGFLYTNKKIEIAKLSKASKEQVQEWQNKGYEIKEAKIGFIVAWKTEEGKYIPIILPYITLIKQ